MDDEKIIDLYWSRSELAIEATKAKYGRLLSTIAYNILRSRYDTEECVNDAYMNAWGAMPPERPTFLKAFLARITRNAALNRYKSNKRRKEVLLTDRAFDEMIECVPDTEVDAADDITLRDALNSFLDSIPRRERLIFLKRYFYMCTVANIAEELGISAGSVKTSLSRTRAKLKTYLERKGIGL